MDKRILFATIIITAALILFGCTQSSNQNQPNLDTPPQTTPTPTLPTPDNNISNNTAPADVNTPVQETPSHPVSIIIENFLFNPDIIVIAVGTTVTWTNSDSMAHTVTGGVLNSPTLSQGQTFSYTFTTVGTIDYICTIHPSMKGKIIVQ